jgi:hypothetical protein
MENDSPIEKALEQTIRLFGMELQAGDDARQKLVAAINELIQHDFNRLLHILYRIDVDEDKLKSALRQQPDRDAAEIIAELMIERQAGKRREA